MTIQAKIELAPPWSSRGSVEEDRRGERFEEKQDCSGGQNCLFDPPDGHDNDCDVQPQQNYAQFSEVSQFE